MITKLEDLSPQAKRTLEDALFSEPPQGMFLSCVLLVDLVDMADEKGEIDSTDVNPLLDKLTSFFRQLAENNS